MVHQKAFNDVKTSIAKDVVLAYPDYSMEFEIYTDASSKQLGSVLTQGNRPLAFFSRKLSTMQQEVQRDRTRTTGHSGNTQGVQMHVVVTKIKSLYRP